MDEIDSIDPWSESLNIMKQENPWDVTSIFDLAYFCCPECDFKHQGKQDFVSHASNNHPWVSLHDILRNFKLCCSPKILSSFVIQIKMYFSGIR